MSDDAATLIRIEAGGYYTRGRTKLDPEVRTYFIAVGT